MEEDEICRANRRDHCWHTTERESGTARPQRYQVCCNCGTERHQWLKPRAEHGPYRPASGPQPPMADHLN